MARRLRRRPHVAQPRCCRRPVRRRVLLARPDQLHLEHLHAGEPGPGARHAGGSAGRCGTVELAARRRRQRGRRHHRGLVHLRDPAVPWPGPAAAEGRGRTVQGLDAADLDGRTQGPRGEDRRTPCRGCRTRRAQTPQELVGVEGRGGRPVGPQRAARGGDHRRRAGRHRAGGAAAAPGRVAPGDREERPAGRQLAQPLQEPVPARPGLVRPPALPALPERLAGVRAQGQDRRLAGGLRQDHGGQLLGLDAGQELPVR